MLHEVYQRDFWVERTDDLKRERDIVSETGRRANEAIG
jgi:hypothetical protein